MDTESEILLHRLDECGALVDRIHLA
jgi:hypothetical protein